MKTKFAAMIVLMTTLAWSYPAACSSYKQMNKEQVASIAKKQPVAVPCFLAYRHLQNVFSAQKEKNVLLEATAYIELWHAYRLLDRYGVDVEKERKTIMRRLKNIVRNQPIATRVDGKGIVHQYAIDFDQMELIDTPIQRQEIVDRCIEVYDKKHRYLGCANQDVLQDLKTKGELR